MAWLGELLDCAWFLSWAIALPALLAVWIAHRLHARAATVCRIATVPLAVMLAGLAIPVESSPGYVIGTARIEFAESSAISLPNAWAWIWLAVASCLAVLFMRRAFGVRRLLSTTVAADDETLRMVRRCARDLGCRLPQVVRFLDAELSPFVVFAPRSSLILPRRLWISWDDDTRRAIVAHELAHLKRHDVWARILLACATAVYWWNPLAWWLRRISEDASERACDAYATHVCPSARTGYARALLAIAKIESLRPCGVSALSSAGRAMAVRLQSIMTDVPRPRSSWLGLAGVAGLLIVAWSTAWTVVQVTPGRDAAQDSRFTVGQVAARALLRWTHPFTQQDIPALVDSMQSGSTESRRRAADDLGNLLDDGEVAVPDLARVARADPSASVRREAIDAIGRIGDRAIGTAMHTLVTTLASDPSPRVRRQAADVLGRKRVAAPVTKAALERALRDTDASVRRKASAALRALRR